MADRRQLYKYKGDRCAHCGRSVQDMITQHGGFDRVFELNHIDPTTKHPDYKNMMERVISTEQLDEVDKCVLLCRTCHGIVHMQNINAELSLTFQVGNKKAQQTLKGQLIIDFRARTGTFLTSDRLLVIPYKVYVGSRKPKTLFGSELENGLMTKYLSQLDSVKKFAIRSWKDDFLFRAFPTGNNTFTVEHDIRFPLISSELCKDDGTPIVMWIRNGTGLMKDGKVIHGGTVTYEGMRIHPSEETPSPSPA